MKKNIIIISLMILTIILYSLFGIILQNTSFAVNQTKSEDINSINEIKYPGIKQQIQQLQSKYPNWKFKILYTGLDWNDVINNEYTGHGKSPKNLIYKSASYQGEWICAICGESGYDNGNWKCASDKAIKYMMDVRNSINESDIFQFEELTSTDYNIETIRTMTRGTFLEGHEQGIINASKNNNINAYYIVARLIQEQGSQGSVLAKGTGYNGVGVGFYNAFNIAASGNSTAEILTNALLYAQKQGWSSLDASIDGGIKFLAKQYIKKGKNTLYLQKFDVEATNGLYSNQYAGISGRRFIHETEDPILRPVPQRYGHAEHRRLHRMGTYHSTVHRSRLAPERSARHNGQPDAVLPASRPDRLHRRQDGRRPERRSHGRDRNHRCCLRCARLSYADGRYDHGSSRRLGHQEVRQGCRRQDPGRLRDAGQQLLHRYPGYAPGDRRLLPDRTCHGRCSGIPAGRR